MNESKIWMRDLSLILIKVYKKSGWNFPKTDIHSLVDLVEWLQRIPSQSPRNVYKSKQLQKKILTPFEIKGLSEIEKLTRIGGNLKPYLGDMTRSIRNRASQNNDYFSSDWGLLNFHLGADFENKGTKVSRTKRILIAKFEIDSAYFIDIVSHGKSYPDVWGDISHLEILYKNWPNVLGKEMRTGIKETYPHSASDYIRLRNAGINSPIVIDKKMFFSPGSGIASDGSQIQAVQISQQIEEELEHAETAFRKIEPTGKALLVLKQEFSINSTMRNKQEFSIGFFVPKKNEYHRIYKHSDSKQVIGFFSNLLNETPLATSRSHENYIFPNS